MSRNYNPEPLEGASFKRLFLFSTGESGVTMHRVRGQHLSRLSERQPFMVTDSIQLRNPLLNPLAMKTFSSILRPALVCASVSGLLLSTAVAQPKNQPIRTQPPPPDDPRVYLIVEDPPVPGKEGTVIQVIPQPTPAPPVKRSRSSKGTTQFLEVPEVANGVVEIAPATPAPPVKASSTKTETTTTTKKKSAPTRRTVVEESPPSTTTDNRESKEEVQKLRRQVNDLRSEVDRTKKKEPVRSETRTVETTTTDKDTRYPVAPLPTNNDQRLPLVTEAPKVKMETTTLTKRMTNDYSTPVRPAATPPSLESPPPAPAKSPDPLDTTPPPTPAPSTEAVANNPPSGDTIQVPVATGSSVPVPLGTQIKDEASKEKDPSPPSKHANAPFAEKTASEGLVKSPYPPHKVIDVRGMAPGSVVKDPRTGEIFRVP